jgi:hypothetical protein
VASPRFVRFRDAGFASVWDWGNDVGAGPTGTPVTYDTDCVVGVISHPSVLVDSALTVVGAYVVKADTGAVTTWSVAALCDQRLATYEVTSFVRDCELQVIALNARAVLADQWVVASNSLFRRIDVHAEIRRVLAEQIDVSLHSYARRTMCGDVLILVPNPTLLMANTSVAVSGRASTGGDQRLTVSGSFDGLADSLQSVSGEIHRWADVRSTVGRSAGLGADQEWRITNTAGSDCDVATLIACLKTFAFDLEIRTTTRLTPDSDSHQTVFVVILRESHIMAV